MQESIQIDGSDGYDFEQIDGYEELSEDLQDKIRNAIETGHIPDEDWKGVRNSIAFTPANNG
jgi:hypothetical protein